MLQCCFPSLVCNKKTFTRDSHICTCLWKFISTLTSGLFCFFRYFSTLPQGCPFQFPISRICRQFSMSQFTTLAGGCSWWFLDFCPSLHVEVSCCKKTMFFFFNAKIKSGWWYTYPSEKYENSSVGMMKFPIWWESHKIPWFQTTNQPLIFHYQRVSHN